MRTAIALRNVIGKAQNGFVIAFVPLHRHFHRDGGVLVALFFTNAVKNILVQNFFALIDEFHKTFDATSISKVVFFVLAFINQTDFDAIVQKRQLTQALGQNFVVELVALFKNFGIAQKVHFGALSLRFTHHPHGRNFKAVAYFNQAVLHHATGKFQFMDLSFALNTQAQPFRQAIDARHAHAMQTT